ncbi:hypothetical protein SAMN03159353_1001219 [Cedecea sp. NFIX57]|nr:hypothetical protein SAMN03159353_1001219 [Cedecea sp. NFIX57]
MSKYSSYCHDAEKISKGPDGPLLVDYLHHLLTVSGTLYIFPEQYGSV